jgi:hypothetical protein
MVRCEENESLQSPCWIWTGCRYGTYGKIGGSSSGQNVAHRIIYEKIRGPIAGTLDHLCEVKLCVNPWHLEDVTARENVRRVFRRPELPVFDDIPFADWHRSWLRMLDQPGMLPLFEGG